MEGASSAIGDIISLGQQLLSERVQERMIRKTVPLVARNLEGLPCRVVKAYSLLLTTVRLVRNIFYYLNSLFKCMYICMIVRHIIGLEMINACAANNKRPEGTG